MAKPLPGIEHVIVLMLENRSFDNVLGGLYPDLTKKGLYRGLLGTETNPLDPRKQGGSSVMVFQGSAEQSTWIMPYPDPGELYTDMVQQIFGAYSVPSGPGSCSPQMSGFAWNYSVQPWSISGEGWPAVPPIPKNIMQYYSEKTMPATYGLGKAFAVCDSWFAAAPVQTIANRVLTHCGTPSKIPNTNLSRVNNYPDYTQGYIVINPPVQDTTIFELLDNRYPDKTSACSDFDGPAAYALNWKVYYHDAPLSVMCQYVYNNWCYDYWYGGNVFEYASNFENDVKNNLLPKYSFIEPCYTNKFYGTVNSNHPGGATAASDPNAESLPPPADVRNGEKLLCEIYSILRANPDLFKKTLLLVTYDEHGGLFDHLGPPCAKSPFNAPVDNFNYDRYGVRVPALLINPYITPGSVYPGLPRAPYAPLPDPPFDHTSILRTLIEQFELGNNWLSPRVQSAPAINGLISGTYTQPPACPSVPSAPPSPVPPPRPPEMVQGTPHTLASALNPLYTFIEHSKRGPKPGKPL
jgi:phospholipase C